jgi:hypothetical protein
MRTLTLTILLLAALTLTTNAYWFNDPARGMTVVTTETGFDMVPQMVRLASGYSLIIWNRNDENNIKWQLLSQSGAALLGPYGQYLVTNAWDVLDGFVIADGEGGAIVVFRDMRNGSWDIYGQRFDSLGNRLWGDTGLPLAIWTGTDEMLLKDVAIDSIGNIFIAWCRNLWPINEIYVQKIDINGQRLWGPYGVIDCGGVSACDYQDIVPDRQGGVFDVWEDDRVSAGSYRLYAQHLDANGNPLWAVNGIELHDPISGLPFGIGYGALVDGVTDGAGGGLWTYTNVYYWYLFRLTGTGQVLWRYTHSQQSECEVSAPLRHPVDGLIWLTTSELIQGTWQNKVYRFDLSGVSLFGSTGILIPNSNGLYLPSISPFYNGIFAVTQGIQNNSSYLLATRFYNAGWYQWQTIVNRCRENNVYHWPVAVPDNNDGAIIVWNDTRAGFTEYDIYAQRILADGTLGSPNPGPYAPLEKHAWIQMIGAGRAKVSLSSPGEISLELYDVLGRKVKTFFQGFHEAAESDWQLDTAGLAAGMYLLQLTTAQEWQTAKMVILK